jgi:hypothetical protein
LAVLRDCAPKGQAKNGNPAAAALIPFGEQLHKIKEMKPMSLVNLLEGGETLLSQFLDLQ